MGADQVEDLCVYQGESLTLPITAYNADGSLRDLTSARVLLVVWDPVTNTTQFTKDSDVSASEVTIENQLTDLGKATIYVLPADLATVALWRYNLWIDDGTDQDLVIQPSRFEVLEAKRS